MNDYKNNETVTDNTTDKKIGENNMMNNVTFRFNGLDAQAIADKILERDRRVAEVDFASLSFDDQCLYMAECHRYEYPCMENIGETIDTTDLVAKLTERAEAGDPIAAYYLLDYQGYFSVREDKRREIARAAAEAGDLHAVVS